jgi:prepilin-type N-terminal cleavage/methylation domain-containing protein
MPRLRQAGFSLLEMLVTLIVIVLITSLVSLAINSGGQEIELEAKVRNLGEVAAYAVDEAQLMGRDYGLLLQQEVVERDTVYSYQWRERLPEGWRPPTTGKDVFADQTLPPGIELELELEGAPVIDLGLAGTEEELPPQVVFYSSGETTAGAIDVRRRADGELLWRIDWDLLGRFRLLPRGEDPELE